MKEKRILFVLPWFPYPMTSGGKQAVFNGIRAVAGYATIFLTYKASEGPAESDVNAIRQIIGQCEVLPYTTPKPIVEASPKSFLQKSLQEYKRIRHSTKVFFKKILGIKERTVLIDNEPEYRQWINVIYPFDEGYAHFINSIIEQKNIDVVQFDMITCANLVLFIPDHVKKILVHHEIRSVMYELRMKSMRGWDVAKQAYFQFFKLNEISILNKFDAIITLSETDCKKLVDYGVTTPVYTSTAVVDTEISDPVLDDCKVLSFVGGDVHYPNYEGIKWFLDNCWHELLNTDNSYHLRIVGHSSEPFVSEVIDKYPNVSFTGFVKELKTVIQNTITIVPILTGSGIRMKILEAATIGCPIVSTSVGAEGLPMQNGINCIIADTPEAFVNAILEYQKPDLRSFVVKNAQKMVKDKYSFASFSDNRLSIYREIMEKV